MELVVGEYTGDLKTSVDEVSHVYVDSAQLSGGTRRGNMPEKV